MRGVIGTCAVLALVTSTCPLPASAADRHVPGAYPDVGAAAAAAAAGDRIVIAEGTYDCTDVAIDSIDIEIVGAGAELTTLTCATGSGHLYLDDADGSVVRDITFVGGAGHDYGTKTYGGAVYAYRTTASIESCRFIDNEADFGGAVISHNGDLTILECLFESNVASSLNQFGAGAVGGYGGYTTIRYSWFEGNSAGNGQGGAIGLTGGYGAEISHCVFHQNEANTGGAIRNWKAPLMLTNSTFVDNVSDNGSAIRSIHASAESTIHNCVIAHDPDLGDPIEDLIDATTIVSHSLLSSGWSGDGESNIIATATFVSDVEPLNLCLAAGTAGVDAGNDEAVPAGVVHDYDGRDRFIGSAVDMGAFETPLEIEPPATGACCVGTSCVVVTEAECVSSAGTYLGDDVTCAGAPCAPPAPTGACCLGVTCDVLTQDDCLALAGEYLGDDVPCGGDACAAPDPVGACCHPDGSCTTVTAAECSAAGGTYEGDDALCAEVACTQPPTTGACCLASGLCSVMSETSCMNQGGTFLGVGASCADAECETNEPVSGACCFSTGGCLTLDGATCDLVGGTFLGAGVSCAGSICSEPDPCPEDLDGSGDVGFNDLTSVLADWGSCLGCLTDLDGDDLVGFNDVVLILSAWGPCTP